LSTIVLYYIFKITADCWRIDFDNDKN